MEEALLSTLKGTLCREDVIQQAIDRATARVLKSGQEPERAAKEHRYRELQAEMQRLTEALALGSAPATVVNAIKNRELEAAALLEDLKKGDGKVDLQPEEVRQLAKQVASEAARLLQENPGQGHSVIKAALPERLTAMPSEDGSCYQV